MKMRFIRSCSIVARAARDRVRVGSFALILVLGLVALLPRSVYAADGDLDTTFGDPNADNAVTALALQPDGKVLIGGWFTTVGTGSTTMRHVARLNSNGTLDTTFGDPNVDSSVTALALQSDGKVLIGGGFTSVGGSTRNYAARLTSTGTLDTSFGDPNVDYAVYALALQSDGKVLIGGGFTSVGGSARYMVARLNSNGTLDTTFGDLYVNHWVFALKLQSNGKVLIGGPFTSVGGTTMNRVARLDSAKPTAVTLSSFSANAPSFDLAAWFAEILRQRRR